MKYLQYLEQAAKINKNKNVNKIILVNLLKADLPWLYANLNTEAKEENLDKYLNFVKQYANGCPLGYILGYVIFNDYKFFVDNRVLIPRDETQYLIEKTKQISKEFFKKDQQLKILDLATGSGFIGINMAFNRKHEVVASDISIDALKVAKKNIELYQLKNITLVQSDLLSNLQKQKFDLIISNPPYIDQDSENYDQVKLQYEPSLALFAKNRGLFFYEQILKNVLDFVNEKFLIVFEFGWDQKEELATLIKQYLPLSIKFNFVKDINDKWRYVFIKSE